MQDACCVFSSASQLLLITAGCQEEENLSALSEHYAYHLIRRRNTLTDTQFMQNMHRKSIYYSARYSSSESCLTFTKLPSVAKWRVDWSLDCNQASANFACHESTKQVTELLVKSFLDCHLFNPSGCFVWTNMSGTQSWFTDKVGYCCTSAGAYRALGVQTCV